VTEEEAKGKWCPHVRQTSGSSDDGSSWNRIAGRNEGAHGSECIASECMAWRWEVEFEPYVGNKPATKGYCGLAGKP